MPVRTPVGTWLSLVEHSLGVRGVGSSNLPVPTTCSWRSFAALRISPADSRRYAPHARKTVQVQICPSRPHFSAPDPRQSFLIPGHFETRRPAAFVWLHPFRFRRTPLTLDPPNYRRLRISVPRIQHQRRQTFLLHDAYPQA